MKKIMRKIQEAATVPTTCLFILWALEVLGMDINFDLIVTCGCRRTGPKGSQERNKCT